MKNCTNFRFCYELDPGSTILIHNTCLNCGTSHPILLHSFPSIGSGENDVHTRAQGFPELLAIGILGFNICPHLFDHVTQKVHEQVIHGDIGRKGRKLKILNDRQVTRTEVQFPPRKLTLNVTARQKLYNKGIPFCFMPVLFFKPFEDLLILRFSSKGTSPALPIVEDC